MFWHVLVPFLLLLLLIICRCMDIEQFICCSSVDGHMTCFHFWAIIKYTSMNIYVQILCGHIFLFLLNEIYIHFLLSRN